MPDAEETALQPASVRVFLSYARDDDEAFVRRLHDDLKARGFPVWFDRESLMSRGLTYHQEIKDAIRTGIDRLVYVGGPRAVASEHVREEWKSALEFDKTVIPILRLGDHAHIPAELALLHCDDFRDDAAYAAQLGRLVANLLRPERPLGSLFAVPSLPPHFLERPDLMGRVRDALLVDLQTTQVITSPDARVGVQGMGGIGKSVLAAALARDRRIRQAYPDGIVWVSCGQNLTTEGLLQRQRDVVRHLGGLDSFDSMPQGQAVLRELLSTKATLLILDDVWQARDAQAFDALGPRCRMLVTTRDAGVLHALNGEAVPVSLFTEPEALQLLADAVGVDPSALPPAAHEVVRECGLLPLALALCGGMARKRDGDFGSVLERFRRADLDKIADPQSINEQHRSIWRAMKASVEALGAEEQQRFAELAVFPADAVIPEAAIATLWGHTGGLDDLDAEELVIALGERALIQVDTRPGPSGTTIRCVSLHDLLHDYVTRAAGDTRALHGQLVAAYRTKCPDGWHSGPNDGYFFQRLPDHLHALDDRDAILQLARDEPFLASQAAAAPDDPDLPLRTLRMALAAACAQGDAVAMAEFTLAHVYRLARQRQETPLEAVLNPALPPQTALGRAWGLADALEPSARAYALVLVAWKLKMLGRLGEARDTLQRLEEKPPAKGGDYSPLIGLLFARLAPDFDVTSLANTLLTDQNGCWLTAPAFPKAARYQETIDSLNASTSQKRGQIEEARPATDESGDLTNPVQTLPDIAITLARAGRFDDARQTAESIGYSYQRANTLRAIATALAEAGRFEEARHTANMIEAGHSRHAMALCDIASALAKAGQEAQQTFVAALEAAARVQEPVIRADTLCAIATALADAGHFEEARQTADAIEGHKQRSTALCAIASAHAKGGQEPDQTFAAARDAANRIEGHEQRADALGDIVRALAGTGCFEEARQTANAIQDTWIRSIALVDLAITLANAGRDPRPTLAAALDDATKIEEPWRCAKALRAIAWQLAKAGRGFEPVFGMALLETAARRHPDERMDFLQDIARDLADAEVETKQAFAAALKAATELKDRRWDPDALCDIIRTFAPAGFDPTPAFAAALAGTTKTADAADRAETLRAIAAKLVERGHNSERIFEAAFDAARQVGEPRQRAIVLRDLACAMTEAHLDPRQIFEASLEAAAGIEDPSEYTLALLDVSCKLSKAKRDPEQVFSAALDSLNTIQDARKRAFALFHIAVILQGAKRDPRHALTAALDAAREIGDPETRCNALLAIGHLTNVRIQNGDSTGISAQAFAAAGEAASMIEYADKRAKAQRTVAEFKGRIPPEEIAKVAAWCEPNPDRPNAMSKIATDLANAWRGPKSRVEETEVGTGVGMADDRFGRPFLYFSALVDVEERAETKFDPRVAKRAAALIEVTAAQAHHDDLLEIWTKGDMNSVDHAYVVDAVGSTLCHLDDLNRARSALGEYLARAASYPSSAWWSCTVLGQLYPVQLTGLADVLIQACEQRGPHR